MQGALMSCGFVSVAWAVIKIAVAVDRLFKLFHYKPFHCDFNLILLCAYVYD